MVSIFWSEPNFQCAAACRGVLRHAAACFKTPTNRPQNQVLRGMLRHASTIAAWVQVLMLDIYCCVLCCVNLLAHNLARGNLFTKK